MYMKLLSTLIFVPSLTYISLYPFDLFIKMFISAVQKTVFIILLYLSRSQYSETLYISIPKPQHKVTTPMRRLSLSGYWAWHSFSRIYSATVLIMVSLMNSLTYYLLPIFSCQWVALHLTYYKYTKYQYCLNRNYHENFHENV